MGKAPDLLCLVTLPDSYVLAIETQKSSYGYLIFEKVCQKLRILEKDFFGLQIKDDKNGSRWLNLRNVISSEVNCSAPVKFVFAIKFFVEPHYLMQSLTREIFFKITKKQFLSGQFNMVGEEFLNEAAAILSYCSEENNENDEISPTNILNLLHSTESCPKKIKATAASMKISSIAEAQRLFLNKLQHCMNTVGHQYLASIQGSCVELSVFPDGLAFISNSLEVLVNHPWSSIQQAVHNGYEVSVQILSEDMTSEVVTFTLKSKSSASAFYRDLTEVFTFYHCDTVGDVVADQTYRDLKGTIVSFFNESSTLGRAYVFDIKHTLKETRELICRYIYYKEKDTKSTLKWFSDNVIQGSNNTEGSSQKQSCTCQAFRCLQEINDSFTCSLCIENSINTIFIPCGHVFSCKECSSKIVQCPLCKESISAVQHIFLPTLNFPLPLTSVSSS